MSPIPVPTLDAQLVLPPDSLSQWSGAFSEVVPGWQIHWDSTSFGAFCTCPFYYYLTMVQGIGPRYKSIHLTFGIAWHSAMERYHSLRAQGDSHESALHWTIAETMYRQLRTPDEKVRNQGYHEEALPTGPLNPRVPEKTPQTLLRSLVQYLDSHQDDDLHTVILPNGKAAVELSFRITLGTSHENEPITYGGHLDWVVSKGQPCNYHTGDVPLSPSLWGVDYKTTVAVLNERYWSQWTPDVQMTGYSLGVNTILPVPGRGLVVDGVHMAVTGAEFARHYLRRSQETLKEFTTDFQVEVQRARLYAELGEWPQNRKACRRENRDCEFRLVCANPNSRASLLLSDFRRERLWDPTKAR